MTATATRAPGCRTTTTRRTSWSRSRAPRSTRESRATCSRSRSSWTSKELTSVDLKLNNYDDADLRPQVVRRRPVPPRQPGARQARLRRAGSLSMLRGVITTLSAGLPRRRPPTLPVRGLDALSSSRTPSPPPARWPTPTGGLGDRPGGRRAPRARACEVDRRGPVRHDVAGEHRRRAVPEGARAEASTSTSTCASTRSRRGHAALRKPTDGRGADAAAHLRAGLGHAAQHRGRAEPDRVQADDHRDRAGADGDGARLGRATRRRSSQRRRRRTRRASAAATPRPAAAGRIAGRGGGGRRRRAGHHRRGGAGSWRSRCSRSAPTGSSRRARRRSACPTCAPATTSRSPASACGSAAPTSSPR